MKGSPPMVGKGIGTPSEAKPMNHPGHPNVVSNAPPAPKRKGEDRFGTDQSKPMGFVKTTQSRIR